MEYIFLIWNSAQIYFVIRSLNPHTRLRVMMLKFSFVLSKNVSVWKKGVIFYYFSDVVFIFSLNMDI